MSESESYMKKPCQHCPFRRDVKPFLHPDRAFEISIAATNPWNSFPCHKTTESDDDGECYETENSKQCAGFLTLRAFETDSGIPAGFEPSFDICYQDAYEMEEAYADEWELRR